MKLNLGCGNDFKYEKGWVNLDITRPCNIKADMDVDLPFKDQSFDLIWASHILEHRHDLRKIQRELARVIKKGGELNVIVPYFLSTDAWGDPTHCRAFSEESFFGQYWPGFIVISVSGKKFEKNKDSRVMWLFAKLVRNELPQREVDRLLSGRIFNK
jgi:ubiquinone/menaquinone biosynthesis C-methylase UbiE